VVAAAAAAAELVCNMVAPVVVVVHSKGLDGHMVAAAGVVVVLHGYLAVHQVGVLHIAIASILAEDREVEDFEQYFHLQTTICLLVRYLF
jgi:3-oxoacyl-(acyl-carrier-protein) synthase